MEKCNICIYDTNGSLVRKCDNCSISFQLSKLHEQYLETNKSDLKKMNNLKQNFELLVKQMFPTL
jgi:Zn-finger protein